MAFAIADRVREQASSFPGGTGAVTLPVSAVSGFQTFLAGWGPSGTGWYCLVIGAQWETGLGTLNAGGTTLTRTTTFHGSSGASVPVNFSAGTMDCFGTLPAAHSTGKLIGLTKFTASGTWTRPAGCSSIIVEIRGGGGGGGGTTTNSVSQASAGGGQGGRSIKRITTMGATEAVTIGAGGTAGTNTGGTGGTGGTTSFGAHCSATGGTGGTGVTASSSVAGGAGGVGSSGDLNYSGQAGNNSAAINAVLVLPGVGGGEGAAQTGSTGSAAASTNGGGGSGNFTGSTGFAGGVGGTGWCIVQEYE